MSEQLILREAIPTDAAKLLNFLKCASQQSNFIKHDSLTGITTQMEEESIDEIYDSAEDELIVAVFDNDIIGFCRLEKSADGIAEFGVVVDSDFWNNGIASYLTEEALNWANDSSLNKLTLEVYKNNSAAIHIYEKYGFVTESETDETIIMFKVV
ncbi:GNAT family N-acetyltransferase [Companilactobacillus insicii]|uniref:GNAT family N-acetyltransferase n=1 Tax=Companilactobacillus insicii TaxID=1732567 RepID=UPI000F76B439|nr:GNAT family N-acetyltransferase [Companilactobacillus insicii]